MSFGSSFSMLFPDGGAVYSEETLAEATRHIASMSANMGGTEILLPLEAVFARGGYRNKPLQVFLFTGTTGVCVACVLTQLSHRASVSLCCRADGEVTNTREVVALCKRQHEATGARVFTFGIGNDVSHALVRDAATAGTVSHPRTRSG